MLKVKDLVEQDSIMDKDDITEKRYTAMTIEDLRSRLKHIAGLCWGLSIDLADEMERTQRLEAENARLRKKVCSFDKRAAEFEERLAKLSPEERAKREITLFKQRMRDNERYKRKAQEAKNDK